MTVNVRPSNSLPLNISIALAASSSVDISTNPKPLERPDILSRIIVAVSTAPASENVFFNVSSVVLYDKPPTYNFFAISLFWLFCLLCKQKSELTHCKATFSFSFCLPLALNSHKERENLLETLTVSPLYDIGS